MFEIIHPAFRNIVFHENIDGDLLFVGVRNIVSLKEENFELFGKDLGWEHHVMLGEEDWDLEKVKTLAQNDKNSAGYFVVDSEFNRVIVQSPIFKTLTQVSLITHEDPLEVEHLLLILHTSNYSDPILENYPLPDSLNVFLNIKAKFGELCSSLDSALVELSNITQLKDFVPAAAKFGALKHFLFPIKKFGYKSSLEYFRDLGGNRRKLNKSLIKWWDKHHKTEELKVTPHFK